MVTNKGLDCKDDLKLFKYEDSKFKISVLPWIWSLNGLINDFTMEERNLYCCRESCILGNWQYKFRTVVSEVSFFVGNPV